MGEIFLPATRLQSKYVEYLLQRSLLDTILVDGVALLAIL